MRVAPAVGVGLGTTFCTARVGVGPAVVSRRGGEVSKQSNLPTLGNYLGAHVGWKTAKAFAGEARQRGGNDHRQRTVRHFR